MALLLHVNVLYLKDWHLYMTIRQDKKVYNIIQTIHFYWSELESETEDRFGNKLIFWVITLGYIWMHIVTFYVTIFKLYGWYDKLKGG